MRPIGARCDDCPLRGCATVAPRPVGHGYKIAIVCEAPRALEVRHQVMLAGDARNFVVRALAAGGVQEHEIFWDSAICCHPLAEDLATQDFFREDGTMPERVWAQAMACCKPHLHLPAVPMLMLGERAAQQMIGMHKITPWIGAIIDDIDGKPWHMVAQHPHFAMRKGARHLMQPIYTHILKAAMRASGRLKQWQWPEIVIEPSKRAIELLTRMLEEPEIAIDTEDVGDSLLAIGLGTSQYAVSLPWTAYYPRKHKAQIGLNCYQRGAKCIELVHAVLASKAAKVMHFCQHDLPYLRGMGFEVGGEILDTLVGDTVIAPELPHGLGYVAQRYYHCPPWKAQNKQGEAGGAALFLHQEPTRLRTYNARDVLMTALIRDRQREELAKYGQPIFEQRMRLTSIAIKMHTHGVLIDRQALDDHTTSLRARRKRALKAYYRLAVAELNDRGQLAITSRQAQTLTAKQRRGYVVVNAGSNISVKHLLIDTLGAPVKVRSETTGKPSIDDEALTWYSRNCAGSIKHLARLLVRVRRWTTLYTRYIKNLPVKVDGRIHQTWRPGAQLTGRWSVSEPNTSNMPKAVERLTTKGGRQILYPSLRNMLIAGPGNVLVKADYSALELKMCALVAGATLLLKWFADGVDVHTRHAQMLFHHGDLTAVTKGKERTRVKNFVYNVLYKGGVETIWSLLVLLIPTITIREVDAMHKWFFRTHHQVASWQDRMVREASVIGYALEKFSGRRRYFFGHVEPTEAVNFPIQAAASWLIDEAMIEVHEALGDWGHILLQVHDELVIEGPLDRQQDIIDILKRCMERTLTIGRYSAKFTVECSVGQSWGITKEIKQ